MSITLRTPKDEIEMSNIAWAFLLNLSESYGWKPRGTKKPKGFGVFKHWSGNYDSSEGQIVVKSDTTALIYALKCACADEEYRIVEERIKGDLKKVLEANTGFEIDYELLSDMGKGYIVDLILFLEDEEFSIH